METTNPLIGLKQGCLASPNLFALFINELAVRLRSTPGLRGVQIMPNDIDIFSLMFADDVALLADSVVGLQSQLNVLYDFCKTSALKVNTDKSKIMVFRKGGQIAGIERWTYDGRYLEIVDSFTYVGVTFTSALSLNVMAKDQAVKAKRALLIILNSMYKYDQLPYNVFFQDF